MKLRLEDGDAASVVARVWDADGRLRHTGVGAELPPLPGGRYFLGLQRLAAGGVADWSFRSFEVSAPVEIDTVTLATPYVGVGEPVRATIRLTGPPASGSVVVFEVLDNFGRCLSRTRADAAEELTFEGATDESLHLYNYANAQLLDPDGELASEGRCGFYLARPNPLTDDLTCMVWEGCAGFAPVGRPMLRRFAQLGMDAVLTGGYRGDTDTTVVEACAMSNLHPVLYVTAVRVPKVDEQGVRQPCITNPGYLDSLKSTLTKQAEVFRRFSPLAYSLGDDQQYLSAGQDACWSPSCRARFASWLRGRYADVEAVNRAWGTSYAAFDDAAPIRKAKALAAARDASAPEFGPLCHWVDHQLFLDHMLMGWHREVADAVEAVDTGAVAWYDCTVEGWPRPGSAFDFWQLAGNSRFCVQYLNPIVHDIIRSAATNDAYHGTWYGGYGLYNYYPFYDAEFQPWWCVFRGINLHGLYYGGNSSTWFEERLIAPDLGCVTTFERIMANIDELRGGIARLLFNARRLNDGIAVVYSAPSLHLTAMYEEGLPRAPEWDKQVTGAHRFLYMQCWEGLTLLLRDLGLSYDVAPAAWLESGEILEHGFRVVVLPFNARLSEAEAATLRRFVEAGGVLLADAFPGVFGRDARPCDGGALADVLGARLEGGPLRDGLADATAVTTDGTALGRIAVDADVALEGATAMGQTEGGAPIFLVHEYGKGRAVCLNVLARDYQIWRTKATEMPFRDAVGRMLAEAGVTPAVACEVTVRGEDATHRVQASEIHRYGLDGAYYVGMLRHAKMRPDDSVYLADLRPKPVHIAFDRTAHVYDCRRRMYRGMTDNLEDVLYPGRAELFALLPYEVGDVRLEAASSDGAVTVTGQVAPCEAGAEPVTHVVHIEVIDPAGRVHRELARNVLAPRGRVQERIFLGLNAAAGPWTIAVRDVASGTERFVTVSAPAG